MLGAMPPLPNTPSWRGAQLKHTDNFTYTAPYIPIFYWTSSIVCSVGLSETRDISGVGLTRIFRWVVIIIEQCFSTAGPRPSTAPWAQ
jgi:hypothetical protein